MKRSSRMLLAVLACTVTIGGSSPRATARQFRLVAATSALNTVTDGWVAWTPEWSGKSGSMTWWSTDGTMTFAEQLSASGIRTASKDPDASVFLLQLEQGRVRHAYVTRMDSGIQVRGGTIHWFPDITPAESASFLRSAWESGGESTLLYMLGFHPDVPGIEAFLTRTAEGNSNVNGDIDLDDRKSALYGLGALGTPTAHGTLLTFIRSVRGI